MGIPLPALGIHLIEPRQRSYGSGQRPIELRRVVLLNSGAGCTIQSTLFTFLVIRSRVCYIVFCEDI